MKIAKTLGLVLAGNAASAFTIQKSGRFSSNVVTNDVPITSRTTLFGLLDEINSGSYDLLSSSTKETKVNMNDAFETFLAELVFSTNDPRIDIMNKYELASDPEFTGWLEKKIESSRDPDERIALRDLLDMIIDIKDRVEISKLMEERKAMESQEVEESIAEDNEVETKSEIGQSMSTAEILKKATQIQTQSSSENEQKKEKKSFYDQELTPEIRLSYEKMLKKVLPPYKAGDSPSSIVFKFYDQFDAQFCKVLNERVENGDEDSKKILEALAVEQQKRIAAATELLKSVLALGEPMKMEGAIIRMAREGKIDEAFLLLLEANENQAKSAGASGPAQLMNRLRMRAIEEKDKQVSSKEVVLLRKLLRTDDAVQREKILEDAFTPRANLLVPGTAQNAQKAIDGEIPDQEKPMPDVPPPDFINACKAVLLNFGNLGAEDENRGDLASRIRKLAAEAEGEFASRFQSQTFAFLNVPKILQISHKQHCSVVATRIYGKGMTLREQQDRVWSEQTTSIFDLERMEIEAERNGEVAPWTNPNADDMFMPGFDKDGRMQIGGI
jgi:hypothetical protein